MFCQESLGKIKFRAFPKRVGPRILSLESVDYFGTSAHYRVVEKIRNLISKTAMVGCCNFIVCKWSCDVLLYTRTAVQRTAVQRTAVVANTRTKSIQKQIKSKYPEEYSTSIK